MMTSSASLFLCVCLGAYLWQLKQGYEQIKRGFERLDQRGVSQRLDYAGDGYTNGAKVFCLFDLEESQLSELGVVCIP